MFSILTENLTSLQSKNGSHIALIIFAHGYISNNKRDLLILTTSSWFQTRHFSRLGMTRLTTLQRKIPKSEKTSRVITRRPKADAAIHDGPEHTERWIATALTRLAMTRFIRTHRTRVSGLMMKRQNTIRDDTFAQALGVSYKSIQSGLSSSISLILLARDPALICFSRAMASAIRE